MNFRDLYKTIDRNKFYIFSIKDLLSFFPDEKKENLKKIVYRWKGKRWIYPLKRGLYELTYPKDINIPDMYIANTLYNPSYVSLETALSKFSIIPEVSIAVTSVTTKPTRIFKNKHGLFIYRTVKPVAFEGYYIEKQGNFNIFIAEPEKALMDFLYFKKYRNKGFNAQDERLNWGVIAKLNKKKIIRYSKPYRINLKELYAYL